MRARARRNGLYPSEARARRGDGQTAADASGGKVQTRGGGCGGRASTGGRTWMRVDGVKARVSSKRGEVLHNETIAAAQPRCARATRLLLSCSL